jgi:hypothetical protein
LQLFKHLLRGEGGGAGGVVATAGESMRVLKLKAALLYLCILFAIASFSFSSSEQDEQDGAEHSSSGLADLDVGE